MYSHVSLIRLAVRTQFGPDNGGNRINQRPVKPVFGGKLVTDRIAQSRAKNRGLASVSYR
jgi:hypothetical protein